MATLKLTFPFCQLCGNKAGKSDFIPCAYHYNPPALTKREMGQPKNTLTMRIKINNLGPLQQAEFILGDLTVICGQNNTGKTYAMHATHGFLRFVRNGGLKIYPKLSTKEIFEKGEVSFPIETFVKGIKKGIEGAGKGFSANIHNVFGGKEQNFRDAGFQMFLDLDECFIPPKFSKEVTVPECGVLKISTSSDSKALIASLVRKREDGEIDSGGELIGEAISKAATKAILDSVVPCPFVISAERAGATIFAKEMQLSGDGGVNSSKSGSGEIDPTISSRKSFNEFPRRSGRISI